MSNGLSIAALTMLDTKWGHLGRRPHVTLDCIGLIVCSAAAAGVPCRDVRGYSRDPDPGELLAGLALNMRRVTRPDVPLELAPDAGALDASEVDDVVALWLADERVPQHVLIRGGRGVIHTWNHGRKVVVEHRVDAWWREHAHSVWRLGA